MKLSIIVPVHNALNYVNSCLSSILHNNFSDFECICVDDCSTDGSIKEINRFVNLDSRFKVIRTPQSIGNASLPRNMGLDIAKGEWVSFIDADDRIDANMYVKLFEALKGKDINMCACSSRVTKLNGDIKYWFKGNGTFNFKQLFGDSSKVELPAVTNCIYKRSMIGDIRFPNCAYGEDLLFNSMIINKINKVLVIPDSLYFHIERSQGLSKTVNSKKIEGFFDCLEEVGKTLKSENKIILESGAIKRRYIKDNLGYYRKKMCGEVDDTNVNFDIDYVFTYVNNNDEVWRKTYIDFCTKIGRTDKLSAISGARFNDLGLLPMLVEGIKTNMSWIRKIFVVVSNIEQVPDSLKCDERVVVVVHSDIIPIKFLPTFNSTTIEMFLPQIKDLSEHFIYGNDDMYPINKLSPLDFFSKDGKEIRMNFYKKPLELVPTQFKKVCYNCNRLLLKNFNLKSELKGKEYYRPYHTMTPMIKSHCMEVFNKCKNDIYGVIRAFRTDKQYNQYIYPDYEKFKGRASDTTIRFKYCSYKDPLNSLCEFIEDKNFDVICINDVPGKYRDEIINGKERVNESFRKRLGISDV